MLTKGSDTIPTRRDTDSVPGYKLAMGVPDGGNPPGLVVVNHAAENNKIMMTSLGVNRQHRHSNNAAITVGHGDFFEERAKFNTGAMNQPTGSGRVLSATTRLESK
mmetsp:Transcript_3230/g.4776  ORF Transcript_3230/g.4776 Transcript_3230/m.4776 type:complete len:106 (+) Transcript_3230:119-436(+)